MSTTTAESYTDQLAREKRERHDMARTAADAIATALTKATGDDWRGIIPEDCYDAHFTLERVRDGLAISASFPTYQNQARQWHFHASTVNVSGSGKVSLYNYRRGDETTPRANIAASKQPALIAADIMRRILPPTDELITRAITSDAETTLREAWLGRTQTALVRVCPLKLEAPNHERRERANECARYRHSFSLLVGRRCMARKRRPALRRFSAGRRGGAVVPLERAAESVNGLSNR